MSHKKAKLLRRLQKEKEILPTGEMRFYKPEFFDAFETAHEITEEMIEELKGEIPEFELRYMQENGYRFSAERKSFLSPPVEF